VYIWNTPIKKRLPLFYELIVSFHYNIEKTRLASDMPSTFYSQGLQLHLVLHTLITWQSWIGEQSIVGCSWSATLLWLFECTFFSPRD